MRIIDSNTDYYDYYQDIYRDSSLTFDRRDSFLLTKDMIKGSLSIRRWYSHIARCKQIEDNYILMQVCNTFWLFRVKLSVGSCNTITGYNMELIDNWKNYNLPKTLISINVIQFDLYFSLNKRNDYINAVNNKEYKISKNLCQHVILREDWFVNKDGVQNKSIPILKACEISQLVNDIDLYLAFEEYFSLEKSDKEKRGSADLTDKEKVENHGFDKKTSFRK